MPRDCGIATFTTHLGAAISDAFPSIDTFVLALNDRDYVYPENVRFAIGQTDVYRRAADFLNVNTVDLVSLQHEYGIFGGKSGAHVLGLLRELWMPIVTTLHDPESAFGRTAPHAYRDRGSFTALALHFFLAPQNRAPRRSAAATCHARPRAPGTG